MDKYLTKELYTSAAPKTKKFVEEELQKKINGINSLKHCFNNVQKAIAYSKGKTVNRNEIQGTKTLFYKTTIL